MTKVEPAQMEDLPSFTYQAPIWSAGDRLYLGLDFRDDRGARDRNLEVLGLNAWAERSMLTERLPLAGVETEVELFGNAIGLTVGPEDPYEHLGEHDYAHARRIQALVDAHGLEAWSALPSPSLDMLMDWFERPWSQAKRTERPWVVSLEGGPASEWRGRVVDPPRGIVLPFDDEVELHDHETGAMLSPDALQPGELGLAHTSVGLVPEGGVGTVISRFDRLRTSGDMLARARGLYSMIGHASIEPPWPSAEALARDVLIRVARGDAQASVERAIDDVIAETLHASDLPDGGLAIWLVRWAVWVLDRRRAPCLFDAMDAARGLGGRYGAQTEPGLPEVIGWVDRGLAARDPSCRVHRVALATQPERPVLIVATDEQLEVLLAAGRMRATE